MPPEDLNPASRSATARSDRLGTIHNPGGPTGFRTVLWPFEIAETLYVPNVYEIEVEETVAVEKQVAPVSDVVPSFKPLDISFDSVQEIP